MSSVVKWSIILAVAVTGANVIFLIAGLHKNPIASLGFIGVAVVLNILAVVMALRGTAAENAYGKQLLNGVLVGAIAGVMVFAAAWLLLTVVFPNAIPEIKEGTAAFLETVPIPADQKEQQLAALEEASAFGNALQGLIGTFFTSVVVGAIAGAFLRKK